MACVDKKPTSAEYMLLQLSQYLSEVAIKVAENLGHSATAHQAAKERLEKIYDGKRRQVALCLEEPERFQPLEEPFTISERYALFL